MATQHYMLLDAHKGVGLPNLSTDPLRSFEVPEKCSMASDRIAICHEGPSVSRVIRGNVAFQDVTTTPGFPAVKGESVRAEVCLQMPKQIFAGLP